MGHAENGFFRMIFHRWIIGFAYGWTVVGRNHRGWWVFAARMKFPAGEGDLSVPGNISPVEIRRFYLR